MSTDFIFPSVQLGHYINNIESG